MEMFSRKETAKILGISLKTLDALREDKRIGYYQVRPGCKVQFTQAQIDKYLKKSERGMKTPQYRIIASESLCRMGNLVFTQGLPIFYAIYDAFFHTTFPTSNGLYTTFPTSKIVVNFRQTTTYCGRFPQKSDPTDLSIRTIGKEKPRKTEVFRGK